MCKRIFSLALCLFLVQAALAGITGGASAQSGRVEGTVSDPNGAKVADVRVSLRDSTGVSRYETRTDAQGRFTFADVADGSYEVVAEAAGFSHPEKATVEVRGSATRTVNLRLAVAAITERVEVSSTDPIYVKLRSAKLSGEAATLRNVTIKRDAATITFKDGRIHFLAPVEGKVTGAVFIGDGEFSMTPPLEIEKKHISILTDTPSITEQFNKLVLRFTDSTYDELKKQATEGAGGADGSAQNALDENRSLLRKRFSYNLDARLLVDLTLPKPNGFFQAYFTGKRFGSWVYGIDPLGSPFVSPEEIMLINLSDNNGGIWSAFHINQHYRVPNVYDEDHRLIDVLHNNITATIKGKRMEATSQLRYKAMVDGVRVFPLDLYRTLRVSRVTDHQGRAVNYIQEKKEEDADFYVVLAEPLKKGQEYTMTVEYAGEEAVLDAGGGNYALNPNARGNWYPSGSNTPFGDRATFEITLKTAKGLVMVATGDLVSETQEGDQTVTRWKSDVPLQVAGFNFGKFKKSVVQDEKTKTTFETYANKELPADLRDLQNRIDMAERDGGSTMTTLGSLNTTGLMDKARAEAQVSVQLFSDMFGPLPYTRIAMTQQPFPNFGQAWPMLVYMPLTAFLDTTHRHQLGMGAAADFFKFVGAHEVAHQWWGHIIGWKSYRDQWMSEGFAQFSASYFAQLVYKNEKFIEFWKDERESIIKKNQLGKRPADVGSVYMGYRLNTAKTGNVARSMIYPKGGFILHMIRMLMWDAKTGDQRFTAMMKDFVKTHYNQDVSTQDFQRAVEKHMTKEMDLEGDGKMNWFFRQWVMGTSIPDYKLTYRIDPGENGGAKLVAKITQSNVDDAFMMRVPIYLDFDGKIRRLGAVNIYGNSTTEEFQVPLPQKPKRVMLSYFEDVLCTTTDR